MKKTILGLILGVMFVIALGAVTNPAIRNAQYPHTRYYVLRAEDDEDTAITVATEGNFAQKPSDDAIQMPPDAVSIQFIISAGSAADKTLSWRLYAWRTANGPLEYVANGTAITGTQTVVIYPQGGAASSKFWVDTLVITDAANWLTTPVAIDSGNNRVSKLAVSTCGYEWWYLEITSADGSTGAEAGDVTVYYSYF